MPVFDPSTIPLDSPWDSPQQALALLITSADDIRLARLPDQECIVIGRDADCDVTIDAPSVSRRHAILRLGAMPMVEDAGSTNGTFVLGKRLGAGERAPVAMGSPFTIGGFHIVVQQIAVAGSVTQDGVEAAETNDEEDPRPIARDGAMIELYRRAEAVGRTRLSVLVLGETGVGKEVVAEALHRASTRASARMVHLNCAAIPETMLESELFGYERGAFTGAVAPKGGLLEAADGGTVFLDEVGDLPLTMQAKLLRVLETGETRRLGSLKNKHLDLRIIAATNRNLAEMMEKGLFRQDLYFRMNEATFKVPALRERRADIAPLAHHFARRAAGDRATLVTPEAILVLEKYAWPGNVRELRGVMERAVASATSKRIVPADLVQPDGSPLSSSPPPSSATGGGLRAQVESHERDCVIEALERAGGNQGEAAKLLNISRRTLLNKLDALGIDRPRKKR